MCQLTTFPLNSFTLQVLHKSSKSKWNTDFISFGLSKRRYYKTKKIMLFMLSWFASTTYWCTSGPPFQDLLRNPSVFGIDKISRDKGLTERVMDPVTSVN